MNRFLKISWFGLMGLMTVQILFHYPELPQRMASHFDFSGEPDDWMDKTTFFVVWIAMLAFMNLMVPLVNWLMKKAPRSLINVPNKEIWMGTESNLKKLSKILENTMLVMTLGVDLIFLYALQHTYEYNTTGQAELMTGFLIVMIVVVMIVPLVYLFRALRITPEIRCRYELEKARQSSE